MRKSRLEWAVPRRFVEHFVSGSTARMAASRIGVNKSTAALYFHRLRLLTVKDETENGSAVIVL